MRSEKSKLLAKIARAKRKEYILLYNKKMYQIYKEKAFRLISGGNIFCRNCKTTNKLEINHINAGGGKDRKGQGAGTFYRKVALGKRKTNDLELLCRKCNMLHWFKIKRNIQHI